MISRFIRTFAFAAALQPLGLLAGVLTISKTQFEVAVAPGFDHADLKLPITLAPGASVADLSVVSDLSWAVPEISPDGTVGVRFQTRDLLSSATATLTVTHGSETRSIFLSAVVKPLDVYRLLDDPFRNVTYGIQFDAGNTGAVFTYDPLQGTKGKCVTVGKRPTDFVISDDGSELLVICSADKSISVIDLATLAVKETIQLPVFENWGSATDTTANIDLGAGDIIYYTDGSWGPIMRVYNRATRQVIQSIRFDGNAPSNDTGFQDFAVTKDRTKMVAMPQYGWSAGSHTPVIAHYSIAADGRLTFLSQSTATTGLQREPFEAPALISENSQTVFLKTIAVSSQNINDIQKSFPSAVWSVSPGGEWVATATDIYDYTTGNKLLTIPGASAYTYYSGYTGTKAQAFTSDYARFVYFNATDRTLNSLNLVDLIGPGPAGNGFSPVPGAVITAPQKLSWAARLGITNYHLYIGSSLEAVNSATQASPEFAGVVSGTQYQSSSLPSTPGTYYWRLDPVTAVGASKGSVYSFTISPIALDRTSVKVRTVKGVGIIRESIQLSSVSSGQAWTASSDQAWIGFPAASGTSPTSLAVTFDTAALPAGVHLGSIKLTTSAGDLTIPVEITLDALKLTVLKSDPLSSKLYGISEDTAAPGSKAYLLEIDSTTESILRVQEVGTSATDLSLHRLDGKIYVTNWLGGALLAVDRTTFQVTRTYPFNTFGGIGYGDGDAYRISSGGPGRLVVEEMDQWVDIHIYNTASGTKLGKASVREGGGGFDSTGRYYYHGENNSSGAKILRYDVTGDVFTQVATARPTGISYYGSRTVVVSEDDQRIFWANVAFGPTLVPEWTVGETVYSCTADGRFAFAENKIYDINRRLWVLGMPVSSKVSAYNSTSGKLVVQGSAGLLFTPVDLPLTLPAPVLQTPAWSGSSLALSWTENSLETGFHLQRRTTGTSVWTDVSTALGQNVTTTAVAGLSDSASYEFRLRATAPEISSAWSDILTVDLSQLPPAAPVLATPSATSPFRIALNWTLSGTNTQVIVEHAEQSSEDWQVIATLPAGTRTFNHESLLPASTHRYRVKALKGSVASPYSAVATVSTPAITPPGAPSFLTYYAMSATRVYVAWYSVSLATSYRIERKLASESSWTLLAEGPQSPTEFLDETVAPGTSYSYRIFAVNTAGTSTASAVRTVTTPALPLPTVPQNFTAHASASNKVTLSWSDSENESGYRLERNIGEGPWEIVSQLPANATSFQDSGLVNGTYYNYRLVAFNANGAEVVSVEVNVFAAMTGAILQDDFDPTVDLGVWSSLVGGQAITGPSGFLSGRALWFGAGGTRSAVTVPVDLSNGGALLFQFRAGNQSVDGNTHWNNSEANENVVLEYSASGGAWEILSILATEYPAHNAWTPFEITLPVEARSDATRFRWRQLSNSGVSQDTWAIDDVEIRGVLPAPPAAPAFILANANAAKAVAVTWASSALATHYVVERRTPSSAWVVVGNTASYETFFTDATALPATAYSYRVLAGNTGGLSEASQHAFVTTWSILQEWRFQNYGTTASNGVAADLATDSGGVANLLKYAFNMSKDDRYLILEPDTDKGLPYVTMGGDRLQIAYLRRRNPASAGIRYIVEFSSDLTNWSAVGTELVSAPVDEDFDYVVCRDSPPVGHAGSRFARVRVETAE